MITETRIPLLLKLVDRAGNEVSALREARNLVISANPSKAQEILDEWNVAIDAANDKFNEYVNISLEAGAFYGKEVYESGRMVMMRVDGEYIIRKLKGL